VALLLEEAKEGFTDFCAFHRFFHGDCCQRQVQNVKKRVRLAKGRII
jgi:hypothetical protein